MAALIALTLFAVLASVIVWYGRRVYSRPGRIYERLKGTPLPEPVAPAPTTGEAPAPKLAAEGETGVIRIIRQIGEQVPISPADATMTRRYLIAAGYRGDNAIRVYYGFKVALCAVFLAAGAIIQNQVAAVPILRLLIVAAFGAGGWLLPGLILDHLVSARQQKLKLSLADALDLMVVCVEAGHGLDQAFARVSKELRIAHKEICEEFGLVIMEMRAGKRRSEALHNLGARTGEEELRNLVSVLIQADRFGTSIAQSLPVHSDYMRVMARQRAEERAAKLSVKLVFPIFFCVLPSLFVVIVGPVLTRLIRDLIPMVQNM
jgi:tight adherence protein C